MSCHITRSFSISAFKIVGCCPESDEAASAVAGTEADMVLVELPTMGNKDLERVRVIEKACGAPRAVILSLFGTSAAVRRLRNAIRSVARAAMDGEDLEALS